MLKTLTAKFSLFFWLIFLVINLAIYLIGTLYFKTVLEHSQAQKIELMVRTIKPIIAINIAFEQKKELNMLLDAMLKEANILRVSINSKKDTHLLSKKFSPTSQPIEYSSSIIDPFTKKSVATIKVLYTNESFATLYRSTFTVMSYTFIFALITFLAFFIYIKKELNILKYIAKTLQSYSHDHTTTPIELKNASEEIATIASTTGRMMRSISKHVQELETFNTALEKQVKEKIKKLHKQEKMMLHQSRQAAMGEMLESIAHQWRQPLNIISLSCVNLETEHDLNILKQNSFKERMKIISHNIQYMSDTIDDFRDFLNPNRSMEYFDPKLSIDHVLTILDAQLKNSGIEYFVNQKSPIRLYGVENEFKQVLFVLINNAKDAIKALDSKTIPKIINFELEERDGESIINFCDNGGGIDKSIINSIFDPYFTTKFTSSGTGIGLYIAKSIVESRMQGKLSVANTKRGCCFSLSQRPKKEELS